jgi:hypothetical protein
MEAEGGATVKKSRAFVMCIALMILLVLPPMAGAAFAASAHRDVARGSGQGGWGWNWDGGWDLSPQENNQFFSGNSNSGNSARFVGHNQGNTGNQGHNRGFSQDNGFNGGNQVMNGGRRRGYRRSNQIYRGNSYVGNNLTFQGDNQGNTGNQGFNEGINQDNTNNAGNQIVN